MQTLRTPDDRFADLPGYDFEPHYTDIDDLDGGELRVHHLDEGPADAAPVLVMHGEPSWCFLYRKVIPPLVAAGHRVIAPDLVGFGRSDKPTETDDYTYARHVDWMGQLLFDHLDLQHITFFGQDWGGLIGFRLLAENADRYDRAVAANTGLPEGDGPMSDAFTRWQQFSQQSPVFPVGNIIDGGCASDLDDDVIAAYDAPFPDDSYKAGARIFPSLVPTTSDDPAVPANQAAWQVLEAWRKPFLTAFSDLDPVTGGGHAPFQKRIPGAQGRQHPTVEGGGHFLQEDRGEQVVAVILDFIATTS